ncbi:hypothetical protein KF728_27670 [Candidatus Obscuribacterales bacterium]|nr:hypothetical protein [Candidatus Obscuribacterales bacterium]
MRTIPKERILRVNCAGYGTDAHWNLGRAKSLNNYSAIIVNPTSIAHLFDKDPELVRKVEQCLAEGLTSLTVDDDLLLRNLAAEIDSRVLELSDFLTQGGVLVYFLCRPFVIQGPSLSLDNYYWLESLAPDQPAERNVRHMSAVSHGRLIEPTADGMTSHFGPYLQQHGLEWSTLIRTEYLTDGYNVLAEAGARKCIAGQLFIVESSGNVVFLPSPYSPDFDKTLIDCLNKWYQSKEQTQEELDAERLEIQMAGSGVSTPAPQTGPALFDREQNAFEPAASVEMETAPAAPVSETDSGFSFSADRIAESISQDARKFEEEVANRVQEPKKTLGNIDLSIFAQTAQQLVQKATKPAEPAVQDEPAQEAVQESAPMSEPSAIAEPEVVAEPEAVAEPESVAQEAPGHEPVAEIPQVSEPEALPEPIAESAPAVDTTPEYALPSEDVIHNSEPGPEESIQSTGGQSLRNILSHAAPTVPESVMPQSVSPAQEVLQEPEAAQQPSPPAMAPAQTPASAASLFEDDDDEFGNAEELARQAAAQAAQSNSGAYAQPQTAPAPAESYSDSGVYSSQAADYNYTRSGAFEQPQVEPAQQASSSIGDSGVFSQAQPQAPAAELSPAPTPEQRIVTPPPAESTILQPPSGFAASVGGPQDTNAAVPPSQPPVQEPPLPPPVNASAGDNSVTNDPNNKSTMDLLRELEKAQRLQEHEAPPQANPPATSQVMTAPVPENGSPARPLLNNLFKKDAADMAPLESPLPAVPPAVPQAMPQTALPPPAPARNTLGALMPAAESRPQESFPLMSKDNNMSNQNVPDWCRAYSFSYLDELKKEQNALATQLQDVQAKLNTVESKISSVEQLKNALLAGEGEALKEAVGMVLGKLGWTINHNNATPNEVLLLNVDQPEALVRIVRSDSHCDRSEVAHVSGSAIAFWEKHDIEPKGLLIACTWANMSPQSRNQRDFEEAVSEFARKKNLCLMTTLQLIGIYRDLELGLVTQDTVRRQMLETSGCLVGYSVEAGMVGARA